MKKTLLVVALTLLTVSTFAQVKPPLGRKAPKTTAPAPAKLHPALRSYQFSDDDFDMLFGSAELGFDKWIMTTDIPANQVPKAKAFFIKFSEIYHELRQSYRDIDKARADSLAHLKADSLNKITKK